MKVIKVGGSVFNRHMQIDILKEILSKDTILIISAFGKTSSKIRDWYYNGENTVEEIDYCFTDVSEVYNRAGLKSEIFENKYKEVIQRFINVSIALKMLEERPPKVLDELLSYGEILSSLIISEYLNSINIENKYIDARTIIKTNSDYGKAIPDYIHSKNNIQSLINEDWNIIITQGFIASDENNNSTTMGFESSNLSAMIFSEALKVDTIEIITKSTAIFSLDPERYDKAVKIDQLNYNSAINLSKNGFKLFYPGMIELAKENNIEIIFRGLNKNEGTLISSDSKGNKTVILKHDNMFTITPVDKTRIKIFLDSKYFNNFPTDFNSEGYVLKIHSKELDEAELNDFFNHFS